VVIGGDIVNPLVDVAVVGKLGYIVSCIGVVMPRALSRGSKVAVLALVARRVITSALFGALPQLAPHDDLLGPMMQCAGHIAVGIAALPYYRL